MNKHFIVSDGTLLLELWPAEEGGDCVTSPLDPELITQAESLEEAFEMAYDARQALQAARTKRLPVSDSAVNAPDAVPPNPP